MLNPIHLQTLVTVIKTGSFADAAKELGFSGSAVSQQIAALEKAAKVTLFERSARSVAPTPAALFLADRSRETLVLIADLEESVSALAAGQVGSLRVGSFATASRVLLPSAFRHFLADHPQVNVRLGEAESHELVAQLQEGQIDVALTYQYDLVPHSLPPDVRLVHLLDESLLVLAPESMALAGATDVGWVDLAPVTWISTREDSAGAESLRRLCARADFEPNVAFRSNNYDVILQFVRTGLGVAVVPSMAAGDVSGVRRLDIDTSQHRRRVSALYRVSGMNAVVNSFLGALRRAANSVSHAQVSANVHEVGPGARTGARWEN